MSIKSSEGLKRFYNIECKSCGKIFQTRQSNPTYYPKVCGDCIKSGSNCVVCGEQISYYASYCKKCSFKTEAVKLGHFKQGLAISGIKNPMSKKENRKKVAEGLCKFYRTEEGKNNKRKKGLQWHKSYYNGAKKLYVSNSGMRCRSSLEVKVMNYLFDKGYSFDYEPRVILIDRVCYPDFIVGKVLIEVCGFVWNETLINNYIQKIKKYLEETDYEIVVFIPVCVVDKFKFESKRVHILNIEVGRAGELRELRLDNVTNVDYTHFLPDYPGQCNQIHSHTSYYVNTRVWGYIENGMVVDFKILKEAVKSTIGLIDHKIVIPKKRNLHKIKDEKIEIRYKSGGGDHYFCIPLSEVYLLDAEDSTLENIVSILSKELHNKLPGNVVGVQFEMCEGVSNGAIGQYWCQDFYDFKDLEKIINFHRGD